MKTIPNKRTTIEQASDGSVELITYAELLKNVMQQRKPEGYSFDDMRKDFRVLDVISAASEEITLEDADFDHLKSKMKTMRWAIVHKDLIQFEDDINSIK